jgi:glycine C-acetyltransferase
MSVLEKSIRLKRFNVNHTNGAVKLIIETKMGEIYNLEVSDVSLVGIGGKISKSEDLKLNDNDIILNSKITWPEHEYSLGRLALKSIREHEDYFILGLNTIDTKIPIDGDLSRYLNKSDSQENAFAFELDSNKFNLASFVETSHTNIDLFARCRQFELFLKDWESNPKFFYNCVRSPSLTPRVKLEDYNSVGRNDYIMMGSNDYLGLAFHPKVIEDTIECAKKYGAGSTGSAILTGNCEVHEELCEELARRYKKESCTLFSSGYSANLGAVQGLTSVKDLIVADVLSHASLQDGMKMSPGTSRFFKHNNVEHLEKILKENRHEFFGSLVVTEGIFSMDGDIAPLRDIVKVAKKYNCRTFVDEAHGIGVIGENGLGVAEDQKILKDVDIIMGNTSKALGSLGGFICADKNVINWMKWYSRSRMFSTSMPPMVAQAALTSLKVMKEEKELIQKLQSNIKHFVEGMRNLGAPVDPNHKSAIIPIVIGNEEKLGVLNGFLKESGIFVPPILYPAVSRKSSRFRFTLSSLHSTSDIDYVIQMFKIGMAKADFTFEKK